MNSRERILASIVGVMIVGALGWVLVNRFFIQPIEEADEQILSLQSDLQEAMRVEASAPAYGKTLRDLKAHLYGADERQVRERARARLDRMLLQCGLPVDMNDISGGIIERTGGDREVGWSIRTEGPLDRVFNFLYTVRNDPYAHRLRKVSINWVRRTNNFSLNVEYLTLVLRDAPDVDGEDMLPMVALDTPEHRHYLALVRRDLFRQFIQKPQPRIVRTPTPPVRTTPPPTPPPQNTTTTVKPTFQLCALLRSPKGYDIWVKNSQEPSARLFLIGDQLAGGEIVMVEFKDRPDPRNPDRIRPSRVIIRAGDAYWAVDYQSRLDEKYRIVPERLPAALRGKPGETSAAERDDPRDPQG